MDCHPLALAVGLTTDAGPGGVNRLAAVCDELQDRIGIPVCNASIATQTALRHLQAQKIAVLTPFAAEINAVVRENIETGGFDVVEIAGTEAPSLPAICETPLEQIRDLVRRLAESDCDAIAQVGTALPVVGLLDELENETGKTIVACNVAVYWQALRAVGIGDPVAGHGRLLQLA